ncbi:MAG: SMC-Scp complex subunit ScpB [Rhodospirillaceae bacterium]|jgi:segregation and condensation protein B|nr:SMC-Scp complex subunit ScpB [Rhodospirillaceae bacterium]MBT6512983.1 SMC-Scp complex subunit ScpB [Rhodospirillaceae bacterium]MBT7612479.1 SMC-Scp complex subunit ScpB [Rhodospirillaceae bacterium]MBT7646331.1 SMC-Scp complex subunit ScpB [Rhodospirillaceae bacterium]
MSAPSDNLRVIEALLFASPQPVSEEEIATRLPEDRDVAALLVELCEHYAGRGVEPVKVAGKWSFRTAEDLGSRLKIRVQRTRKMSRAALETLAIIAYHQPVTRAEIEEIRGVGLSRGTLDLLLEIGWVRPSGRRRVPGRPLQWRTSQHFLEHFGLDALDDLPGRDEMKAAGLLDARPDLPPIGRLRDHLDPDGEEGGSGENGDSDGDGDDV